MLKNKNRLLWVEVDLKALRNNYRAIRASLRDPSVRVLAVVKDDAYGHGMVPVARALWREGVSFFGVANIEEALTLRKALPRARILTLGCFHPSQIASYVAHNITPNISCIEDAVYLNRKLVRRRAFAVHVKVDTGMGRLGLPHRDVSEFFRKLKSLPGIDVEGIFTHYSSADDDSVVPTHSQLQIFSDCILRARLAGYSPKYIHTSNSMGMLRFKEAQFNLVRPGLILYGLKPSPHAHLPKGIRPVLSWKTRISFLKKFDPGQTVSYGRTHSIQRPTVIAALPVGYAHGYRIAFSNQAFVLVAGRRCKVAGRVTMDQTLIDVGHIRGIKRWDEACIIGRQGKSNVFAEELAGLAHTIPYEVVCSIHSRIPRLFF